MATGLLSHYVQQWVHLHDLKSKQNKKEISAADATISLSLIIQHAVVSWLDSSASASHSPASSSSEQSYSDSSTK